MLIEFLVSKSVDMMEEDEVLALLTILATHP